MKKKRRRKNENKLVTKNKMTKISILGCGWLGFPLAKALITKGFSVNGSTTSVEKLPILENSGISPFLINVTGSSSKRRLTAKVFQVN